METLTQSSPPVSNDDSSVLRGRRLFLAGHRGMVGQALQRALSAHGVEDFHLRSRRELDLCNRSQVEDFFARERPEVVILAAARVGGIKANMEHPAEFIYENLAIQTNVIHAAWQTGVKLFCFLGSSCIYPRACPQPMKEEHLLSGPLEPTNEAYALAKIAGLKMVSYYRRQYDFPGFSVMPCNLYGPGDCFDLERAHVLGALMRRFHHAIQEGLPEVTLWGTGSARREFLHVDDAAHGIVALMERFASGQLPDDYINLGCGEDVSIAELAELIARVTGFQGEVRWDRSRPDGMPRKCLDVGRLRAHGVGPGRALETGVRDTLEWYQKHRYGKDPQ